MGEVLYAQQNVGEIAYPFLNLNGSAVDVWERVSNLISNFIMYVITYLR